MELDSVTCAQLVHGKQSFRDQYKRTLAGEIALELRHEAGYFGDDVLLGRVETDINTMCNNSVNPDFTPAQPIRDDLALAVQQSSSPAVP